MMTRHRVDAWAVIVLSAFFIACALLAAPAHGGAAWWVSTIGVPWLVLGAVALGTGRPIFSGSAGGIG